MASTSSAACIKQQGINTNAHRCEMNELRVVEGWDNFDQLSMMQQDCAISG